jgi:hypothetical protein
MASVVLRAKAPVNVWADLFIFEVYYAEDTATYFKSLLPMVKSREKNRFISF